jgi:diguanylate cyclase (GGDEF)-like protein
MLQIGVISGFLALSLALVATVIRLRRMRQDLYRLEILYHLANRDDLTGLFSRRRFSDEVRSHMARVARYGGPATVIVVDLDRLERVNRKLGHEVGDEMIRSVARAIRERLRDSDVAARLGGDEFGVLLPETDAEGAATVARDLLRAVKSAVVEVPGAGIAGTTASIGMAHAPEPTDRDGRALIAAASSAMEESKRAGGDRVTAAKVPAESERAPYPTWA